MLARDYIRWNRENVSGITASSPRLFFDARWTLQANACGSTSTQGARVREYAARFGLPPGIVRTMPDGGRDHREPSLATLVAWGVHRATNKNAVHGARPSLESRATHHTNARDECRWNYIAVNDQVAGSIPAGLATTSP